MPDRERVTVTLPTEIVRDIDRLEANRSKFVLEAVKRELRQRRRAELRRSLRSPSAEATAVAQEGFAEWANGLPDKDSAGLVDAKGGTPVRWVPGSGWEGRRK
jgi:hypothetical protein